MIFDQKEIKKILVKCPPGIENAFSLFPFLVALSEEYTKAVISLVTEENCGAAFAFLPFKARFFERPKEKLSLLQTHHFCVNLHDVFNIDLFFDLENNFNSSFMGYNFRSLERVGYENGLNKFFLTKKYHPQKEPPPSMEVYSLKLLELYLEKNFQDLKIIKPDEKIIPPEIIDPLFNIPDPPKKILIMLDNFINISKQIKTWTQFFDAFLGQEFIIWSMDDQDLVSDLFSSVDLGDNKLFMQKGTNPKDLTLLLNQVEGVVVNNVWAEGLCTYFGVNSFSFFHQSITNLPKYAYFISKPQRFIFEDLGKIKFLINHETVEFENINQVVDHIHLKLKL